MKLPCVSDIQGRWAGLGNGRIVDRVIQPSICGGHVGGSSVLLQQLGCNERLSTLHSVYMCKIFSRVDS